MGIQHYGSTIVETAAESSEELGFLTAITSDHLDDVPKLIYADWLHDRDDPRGPFLREFVRAVHDRLEPLPHGEEFSLAWRQVVGIQPRVRIREHVLAGNFTGSLADRVEDLLMRRARPTLYLAVTPADDTDLPVGCTKVGGCPDLSAEEEWPVAFGMPLAFCGQVRLSDLRNTVAGRELPPDGLLSFFHLPNASTVRLRSQAGPFSRSAAPTDADLEKCPRWWSDPRAFFPIPPGAVRLIEGLDWYIRYQDRTSWTEEFYYENSDYFDEVAAELIPPGVGYGLRLCQLLGNGLEYNGGEVDQEPGMRRLATFGSDPNSPHYWGDSGQPIWYLPEADLRAGLLENALAFTG